MAYYNISKDISAVGEIKLLAPKWWISRLKLGEIPKAFGLDEISTPDKIALAKFPECFVMRGYFNTIKATTEFSDVFYIYFSKIAGNADIEFGVDVEPTTEGYSSAIVIPFTFESGELMGRYLEDGNVLQMELGDDLPVTEEGEVEMGIEFLDFNTFEGKPEDFLIYDDDVWRQA